MCKVCYEEYLEVTGGTSNGADPPAFTAGLAEVCMALSCLLSNVERELGESVFGEMLSAVLTGGGCGCRGERGTRMRILCHCQGWNRRTRSRTLRCSWTLSCSRMAWANTLGCV